MYYIMLGCAGFLTIHLFDVVALKKWPVLKPATWALGTGTLVYAIIRLFLDEKRFSLPLWISSSGWVLLVLSLTMLGWSLFVSLPFRKTYVKAGVGDRLITTGFYALVRHPGVHGFSLALVALVLITKSMQMLTAVPVFIALDVILVIVQDRWVFSRMFRDYAEYQRVTPMLIPNRQSIRTFLNSVNDSMGIR